MSKKVAIVTGGTSGIGRATALALQERGYTVYELSRRAEGMPDIRHIVADITKEETLQAAVEQVLAVEGRLDLVVNNAGFGISGAIEFTDTQEAQRLFDTLFFGMVRMNRCVIPLMRQQGHAGKAAINAYTMALANELRPFGVTVCAVMPGDIKTGFTAARHKIIDGDDIYQGRIGRSVQRMEHDEQTGMDPAKVGRYIAAVASREGSHHPLYATRIDYKFFVFLTKVLPARFLNWLIYQLYGK